MIFVKKRNVKFLKKLNSFRNSRLANEISVQRPVVLLVDSTDIVPVERLFAANDEHLFADVLVIRLAALPVGEVEWLAAGRPDPLFFRFIECSSRPEMRSIISQTAGGGSRPVTGSSR